MGGFKKILVFSERGLSEVVKQRVLNSVLVYLARTKATNFQRVILMGAKAKQNNNATKLNQ
ncbi:hypothetical protein JP0077_04680 [Helicobacter pylori]|uniref:hypothetical protein n=1 Tax=Helicobacter pylori TaxID=210 RepID=UPI001AAA0F0B|nr:hypothetical protein [Helicobacter pylori]GHQ76104.1 hypothetical protein JP0077_04680 [Helicobacter pylori]